MSLITNNVNLEDVFRELIEFRQRVADLERAVGVLITKNSELEDANRVSTTRISDRVKSNEIERLRTENTLLRNTLVDTLVSRCFSDLKISTIDTVVDVIAGSPLNTNVVVCDGD